VISLSNKFIEFARSRSFFSDLEICFSVRILVPRSCRFKSGFESLETGFPYNSKCGTTSWNPSRSVATAVATAKSAKSSPHSNFLKEKYFSKKRETTHCFVFISGFIFRKVNWATRKPKWKVWGLIYQFGCLNKVTGELVFLRWLFVIRNWIWEGRSTVFIQ